MKTFYLINFKNSLILDLIFKKCEIKQKQKRQFIFLPFNLFYLEIIF